MNNYPPRGSGTITTDCMVCDTPFEYFKSNKRKYCSKNCSNIARKDYRHSEETLRQMSKSMKGVVPKNMFEPGEKNINWKGGISTLSMKIRQSKSYREWRRAVLERDNYTCQMCGRKYSKLNAHHKIPFSESRLNRLDLDNGITLCVDCHATKHQGRVS